MISISQNVVTEGPIDRKSSLNQVMAWWLAVDKPLPEPMVLSVTALVDLSEVELSILFQWMIKMKHRQWFGSHTGTKSDTNHGPLARYAKLRIAHVPGMSGTFSRHRGLAISTCITARAWRGENVPGIHGACAIRNFAYLVRGPLSVTGWHLYAHVHKRRWKRKG